jgi:hypothetical protein
MSELGCSAKVEVRAWGHARALAVSNINQVALSQMIARKNFFHYFARNAEGSLDPGIAKSWEDAGEKRRRVMLSVLLCECRMKRTSRDRSDQTVTHPWETKASSPKFDCPPFRRRAVHQH